MKNVFLAILLLAGVSPHAVRSDEPTMALPRRTPESQGVSTAGILAFVEAADQQVDSMHSFMVLRHGSVVAEGWWEPESADKPHVLWSLSKSFTSTAVGLAIQDGKLDLDDPVLKFFPDQAPESPSDNLKQMSVRDLLSMSAGHETEVRLHRNSPWTEQFLAHPVPHEPGTHFKYNTPATYMLSAIVQKVTGESVLDYLTPRLFEPLGIAPPRWDQSPDGVSLGGYGLYLRTEEIARFGQLLLQEGTWKNSQLVPVEWIQQATAMQVSNGTNPSSDWNQGYGFQFWRCRHNAFRGDGKDGQFCVVLPEHNAVVVMTARTGNLQGQLQLVWDHLLPAFHEEPLEEAPRLQQQLKDRLAVLKATR